MNALPFTWMMIWILAVLTYLQIDAYRHFHTFQSIVNHRVENIERKLGSEYQVMRYQTFQKGSNTTSEGVGTKVLAGAKLSISTLLTQSPEWEGYAYILKGLIRHLYQDQPFYKKALQTRPRIVDELVDSLPGIYAGQTGKIKTTMDIATFDFNDGAMSDFWYKIVKGAPRLTIVKEEESLEELEEETDDGLNQDESAVPRKSYRALTDFLTLKKCGVRIWLASQELLEVLFPGYSGNIIAARESAYSKNMDKADVERRLRAEFEGVRDPRVPEGVIDYTVTKTKPHAYR